MRGIRDMGYFVPSDLGTDYIWPCLALFDPVWLQLIWTRLELFGPFWSYLAPFCPCLAPVWPCLALFDLI